MLFSFLSFKSSDTTVEPEGLNKDHYHLYLQSIRGDKNFGSAERIQKCPSLQYLNTTSTSLEDLMFRNRDFSSMNLIFVNEYALEYDINLYSHFIKKYIYQSVLIYYWTPIMINCVFITFIALIMIILTVNREVIEPIHEMS